MTVEVRKIISYWKTEEKIENGRSLGERMKSAELISISGGNRTGINETYDVLQSFRPL